MISLIIHDLIRNQGKRERKCLFVHWKEISHGLIIGREKAIRRKFLIVQGQSVVYHWNSSLLNLSFLDQEECPIQLENHIIMDIY